MQEEIQRPDDDIFYKVEYDRQINRECEQRFRKFITENFDTLQKWIAQMGIKIDTVEDFLQHWEWAWMNLATRCFGHYHMPNEIAMMPLLDLANHVEEQNEIRFFLLPQTLNKLMLELDIGKQTNSEI